MKHFTVTIRLQAADNAPVDSVAISSWLRDKILAGSAIAGETDEHLVVEKTHVHADGSSGSVEEIYQ